MKKTLLLMALLGAVSASSRAETVTWDGVTYNAQEMTVYGAVTSYKHNSRPYEPYQDTADYNLCGPASASNVLAWWVDRVEQSGALIVAAEVPRGYDVWEEVRTMTPNKAINPSWIMQYWLTGYMYANHDQWLTADWREFGGYFTHLQGGQYKFDGDPRPDNCLTSAIASDGNRGTYQTASAQLVQGMKDGWAYALDTGNHYMTVYGATTNEEGLITEIYFSDNNDSGGRQGYAHPAYLSGAPSKYEGEKISASSLAGYTNIVNFFGLRSKGLEFDTYDMTMTGEAGEEDLFSHYLNLTIDGHTDYKLQYDLRDAHEADSPIVSNLPDGTHVKTGNLRIKDGKVTLIDSNNEQTREYDRGGSVAGSITYEDKVGAQRTLVVDRTGNIAAEIAIHAEAGNTLEVTGDNTASFGKLTGEGNLAKTGSGTAEVTGEVTLKGSIAVQEGRLVLGSSAALSTDTVLSVGAAGNLESKADAPVTLSINSGRHTNDGEMLLTTTLRGGVLKGSGTFGQLLIDGGTLIVGNSPGHQVYEDRLTLSSGELVFCAAGFETPSSATLTGWDSGAYSTIDMGGNDFVVCAEGRICIDLNDAAAESLTLGGPFSLELVTDLGHALSSETLAMLADITTFRLSDETEAGVTLHGPLAQPRIAYTMEGSSLILTITPEPGTATLSLLALAAFAARRRRK